jgi:NAD(P)H dehydrogenase (quinone)
MTDPIRIAIAFHSGYGHTARQAASVAAGVHLVPGAKAELHDVSRLDPELWEALADSDGIVFGSPTYMGSASAVFQAFAEASSSVWAAGGWRGKIAAGFTNSAGVNGDKLNTLVGFSLLAAQHGMHWVNLGLAPGWLFTVDGSPEDLNRLGGFIGALAQSPSDGPAESGPSDSDLRTAEHLGCRVAETALQLTEGRRRLAGSGVGA